MRNNNNNTEKNYFFGSIPFSSSCSRNAACNKPSNFIQSVLQRCLNGLDGAASEFWKWLTAPMKINYGQWESYKLIFNRINLSDVNKLRVVLRYFTSNCPRYMNATPAIHVHGQFQFFPSHANFRQSYWQSKKLVFRMISRWQQLFSLFTNIVFGLNYPCWQSDD